MKQSTSSAGSFSLAPGISVNRMGFGAMQLAGPGVFGPPEDEAEAIKVLQEAVELGVNHIDTSDFYGPHVTNKLIKKALSPYPEDLHIVTKVGARRDDNGNWLKADSPEELRQAVLDNLENLGLDSLEVVNLRIHGGGDSSHQPTTKSIGSQFRQLEKMQKEGLIKHLGISTATAEQIEEAQTIAPVVCVQNMYNIANRSDDDLIDSLNEQGIAYVPYFPLGGFSPLQSDTLSRVAASLGVSAMTVALAWLLQRSPNILLIPGTSSVTHLYENMSAAQLELPQDALDELDTIGRKNT